MARKPASPQSPTGGIDLSFRPKSYSWPMGLEKHLLATVKGALRREELKQLLDAGRYDDIPDFLARSSLGEAERRAIGRIHPAFMGGEYLPDRAEREVEIARITIASVTRDVTSVYARTGRRRIRYRVVDEYEGETLAGRATRTSVRPLALGELLRFFDGAWPVLDVLAMNFDPSSTDPETIRAFVLEAHSPFYPDFGRLVLQRIEAWIACAAEIETDAAGLEGVAAPQPGPGVER
jgi:hypothetical protein